MVVNFRWSNRAERTRGTTTRRFAVNPEPAEHLRAHGLTQAPNSEGLRSMWKSGGQKPARCRTHRPSDGIRPHDVDEAIRRFSDDCWKLSDAAFRLHVEGLNWTMRKLAGGIHLKDEMRLWPKHPEAAADLVERGYSTAAARPAPAPHGEEPPPAVPT